MGIVTTTEERPVVVDVVTAVCDGCGATHEMQAGVMLDRAALDQGVRYGWTTLAHAPGASVHLTSARDRADHTLCGDCMGRVREALAALPKLAERLRE